MGKQDSDGDKGDLEKRQGATEVSCSLYQDRGY